MKLKFLNLRMKLSKNKNGADRVRTDDIQLAKLALSQLSYSPSARSPPPLGPPHFPWATQMVGLGGLEPPTLRLSGVRSNQLSYRPLWTFLIEPSTCILLSSQRAYSLSQNQTANLRTASTAVDLKRPSGGQRPLKPPDMTSMSWFPVSLERR